MIAPVEPTDLDRRIWAEEIDEFVPRRVFDIHTHLYRSSFYLDPDKDRGPYRAFAGTTGSAGLMLVHPAMTADFAEKQIDRLGLIGFKPYRFYAASSDPVECLLTDFMPAHLLAVADRRGLIVMMHLAKRDAVADSENVDDLLRLCEAYRGVRWVLAHCARSYSAWAIEAAAKQLRGLPNVWYDTSSVCE